MRRVLSVLYRLSIAFILALCGSSFYSKTVVSFDASDYFEFNYSVSFKPDEVTRNEIFYATITGTATCITDLPATVSEGYIIGSITATHQDTKREIIMIPEYTLNINPFPTRAGEITKNTVKLALSFPKDSELGRYTISGNLIEAKVKSVLWVDVTSYLPEEQELGSVLCYVRTTPTITPTITSTQTTTTSIDYAANFALSDLRISPDKIYANDIVEHITVTVHVENTGNLYGLYQLCLKIDNEVVVTEDISLLANRGQDFSFSVPVPTDAGPHLVDINGLTGSFTVSDNDYTTTALNTITISSIIATTTHTAASESATNTKTDSQVTGNSMLTTSSHNGSSGGSGMNALWIILLAILACDIIILCIYFLYSHPRKKAGQCNKEKDNPADENDKFNVHIE